MKKRNLITLLLVAVLAISTLCLAACDNDEDNTKPVEYTVTFDYGDGKVETAKIKGGEKVNEPDAPVKDNYDFKGWYNGEVKYDFDTPVNKDLTLTAKWELSAPTTHIVTFDTDGGSEIESRVVNHNENTYKPINPTRGGYCFDGWYVGDKKYDFLSNITDDITIKAKWISVSEANEAFAKALAADYSNFTSANKIYDAENSYTDVFKQAGNLAYWETGSALYEDHFVIFDDNGYMLAMYYLNGDQWTKSNLSSYADFVLALDLDDISVDDVEYCEGVYNVAPESVASVIYALFRSTESYEDFYIKIDNEHITEVGGTLSGGDVKQEQTFFAYGETEIEMPNLPAVNVQVETKNKDAEEGVALNASELIGFMFNVKVEGKAFEIALDMVDFGDLDLTAPTKGTYTVTLTFETWDGVKHTETATISVIAVQAEETFADIFAKDYSNVTISYKNGSSITTYKHIDNLYQYTASGIDYYLFSEADGSLTRYRSNNSLKAEKNQWLALARLEMIFALNSDLFLQIDETNVYEAKNNEVLEQVILKNMLLKTAKLNKMRDYSISLTVTAGRVSEIVFKYYYVGASASPTASNGTLRTTVYQLSDYGTTNVTIPEEILAQRTPATTSADVIAEDKKYIA